ncbi:MAG: hypothetical protein Q8S84_07425 [bacterium]|nr:hypothetical protein [bacterium]
MKKTEEKMNKNFLIKMENIEIKTMFTDGKIWLTKREIANIY